MEITKIKQVETIPKLSKTPGKQAFSEMGRETNKRDTDVSDDQRDGFRPSFVTLVVTGRT